MQHLKHVLAVIVPLLVAAASSLAVSPAAQTFAAHHPGDVAYILAGAGVLRAIYKALQGSQEPVSAAPAPDATEGPGSPTMSARG